MLCYFVCNLLNNVNISIGKSISTYICYNKADRMESSKFHGLEISFKGST